MLTIVVPSSELYNEETQMFEHSEEVTIELEHSLVSLSKWESMYEVPFLSLKEKTTEQTLSYIEAMIISPVVPSDLISRLTADDVDAINAYINAKRTATWFSEDKNAPKSREIITSEVIYYWMFSLSIPMECETWHLNRLFTLIKVFNEKNSSKKKLSKREISARNAALNAQRRAQLGTKG